MADIRWIKVVTNMFDNRKIKQIENLPDGDAIIVVWLKLLCLAGNINEQGLVYFTKEIPYTEEMMATEFNRPINTVRLALRTFEEFGMIEIIDDVIMISNWERYQNVDGMDKIREQTRLRVQKHREKQKRLLEEKGNVTLHVTLRNETDIDKDKEKEEEKDKDKKDIYTSKKTAKKQKKGRNTAISEDCQRIIGLYESTCISFPKIRAVTNKRQKLIDNLLEKYSEADFLTVFTNAENSSFLKGEVSNWSANIDWMLNEGNFVKILEGNYADRVKNNLNSQDKQDDIYKRFLEKGD